MDPRPVVGLALAVRPFAVGAVEPHFRQRTVMAQQFGELGDVDVVVGAALPVAGVIAVPRREVEARAQAGVAAGVDEFAHQVALAGAPRAGRHRMRGGRAGPQAEAVVMLGGEHDAAEARVLHHLHPLPRIERRGCEQLRVLLAGAPFAVGEGVDAEMHEQRELLALPGQLRGRRARTRTGFRSDRGAGSQRGQGRGRSRRAQRGEKTTTVEGEPDAVGMIHGRAPVL